MKKIIRITPRLKKAIEILSYSKIELIDFIEKQIKNNFFIVEKLELPFGYEVPVHCDLILENKNGKDRAFLWEKGIPKFAIKNNEKKSISLELNKLHDNAVWLKKTIEYRNNILLLTAQKIFQLRKYFKNINLKEIARGLNLHISTISRILKNKYVYIHGDIFELKTFLGGRHAVGKIKNIIKKILKEKGCEKITDNQIKERLFLEDFNLSRRTINKYRNKIVFN